jgi:hypothetical protein
MKILLAAGYYKIKPVNPYEDDHKLKGETPEYLLPAREKERERYGYGLLTYFTYFRPFRLQTSARDTISFIFFTFRARDHLFLSLFSLHAGSGSIYR